VGFINKRKNHKTIPTAPPLLGFGARIWMDCVMAVDLEAKILPPCLVSGLKTTAALQGLVEAASWEQTMKCVLKGQDGVDLKYATTA
jgi:hypothetical protein